MSLRATALCLADVFCAFSVFSTKLAIDTYCFGIEEAKNCIKIHSAKVYIYKKYAPAFAEGIFFMGGVAAMKSVIDG